MTDFPDLAVEVSAVGMVVNSLKLPLCHGHGWSILSYHALLSDAGQLSLSLIPWSYSSQVMINGYPQYHQASIDSTLIDHSHFYLFVMG